MQESDLDQIAVILDSLVRAVNAGDVENLMSFFAPERHELRAEVQQEVQKRVRHVARFAIDYTPLDQNTRFHLSRSDVKARLSASGEGWELNDSPIWFSLEKRDDRWLIADTDFHKKLGAPWKPIRVPVRVVFNDRSTWFLLLANAVTIVLAVTQGWDLITLMWIYWFQSVAIGATNTVRILQLREFSTRGIRDGRGRPVEATEATKRSAAWTFLGGYGVLHLGYLIFLLGDAGAVDYRHILPLACLFVVNHLFSYFYNRPRDTKRPKIGALVLYPFARILPMHFVLAVAYMSGGLALFLVLKTLADVIMHSVEHGVLRKDKAAKGEADKPEPAKAEAGKGDNNDSSDAEA